MPHIARGAMHTIVPVVHRLYKLPSEFIFHCSIRQTGPRYHLHAAQSATTPDLTWLSQKLTGTWNVLADARGSDHFPLRIQLTALSRAKARSPVPIIQWDAFELHSEISPENGRCLTACKKPDVQPHVLCSLLTPRQSPTNIFSTSGRPGKKPKISTSPTEKPCLTEFALTAQLPTQPNMPTDWLVKIGSGIANHFTAAQEPAAFGAPSEDYPSAPAFAQQKT
ncbi:hypothetical protein HPB49_024667 [Dermacentor silvarum]|uniref:Uncharacterized protein n=1 Tax=Dermacentor silvarum TaxID=543639 RepID=A0ACB8C5Z5_DERSI|nr:hypothetical protein HPB49_024667 [Dermacentor silvarum]